MIWRILLLFICVRLGWSDKPWERPCSEGCALCYVGICQECKMGWFDHDCTSRCNDRCERDGSCQGMTCNNGCPHGRYGSDCRNFCSGCSIGCHQFSGTCKYDRSNDDDSDDNNDKGSFPYLLKAVAVIASVLVVTCVVAVYCRKNKDQTTRSTPETANNYLESIESIPRQPYPRGWYEREREDRESRTRGNSRQGSRRYEGHSPRSRRYDEEYTRYDRHSPRERRYGEYSSRDGYGQRDSGDRLSNRSPCGSIHSHRSQGPPTVVIEEPVDRYPVPSAPSVPTPPSSPPVPTPPLSPPPPPPPTSYGQSHAFDNREPPPAYSSLFPSD